MPVILESIVTTLSDQRIVNIAPMGPEVVAGDELSLILRPFEGSTTYRNLVASGRAVVHVTDNALLIARAAIGTVDAAGLGHFLSDGRYWRLDECHRYWAVEAISVTVESPRAVLVCKVVDEAIVRPFFGFNRAKHAVIEAAILATRTHLIPAAEIRADLARLRPLIDKTGAADEHVAFEMLTKTIDERLQRRTD